MLNRLWDYRRAFLLLAVIWLVFECWISWAAFCDQPHYNPGNSEAHKEYSCQFRGPVLFAAQSFRAWWRHTFDEADAYVALFTAVLAVSTIFLWWSTRGLLQRTKESIDLARAEFVYSHRPKLVVRRFQLRKREGKIPPRLEFVIANTGQTRAKVVEDRWNFKCLKIDEMPILEKNPFFMYDDGKINILKPREYEVTQRNMQTVGLPDDPRLDALIEEVLAGTSGFACFGIIQYEDELGGKQETGFFRTYQMGEQFFRPSKDPDHEYS